MWFEWAMAATGALVAGALWDAFRWRAVRAELRTAAAAIARAQLLDGERAQAADEGPEHAATPKLARWVRREAERLGQADRQRNDKSLLWDAFLNGPTDLVLIADERGGVLDLNTHAQTTLGWSRKGIRDRTLEDFLGIHPVSLGSSDTAFSGKDADGHDFTATARCSDGRELPVAGRCMAVQLSVGRVMLYAFRDRTGEFASQRALEAALSEAKHSGEMRARFLANMSHEIRTPLNGLIGMVDLIAESALDGEQREQMRLLRSSAKRLMSLLVDILDFSKIEAGHMVIESITFDLNDKLRQSFGLFEPLAKAKNVKFRFTSELAYRYVTGDSNRIIQVVSNLLDNALKFTKAGSVELIVATVADPDNQDRCLMRIEVRDTGSGIEASSLTRLFSPFTQSDESISRKFGGTGLGLALCKQLCELMGGHIRVESQLGVGSTFALEIPMLIGYATNFEDTSPGNLETSPSTGLEGRAILLIDDNEVNQALLATWLRRRGAQLTLASDGESGIRHAMKQRFDAILMDVAMPRLSGIDATKLLRATSLTNPQRYGYLRRIPIIGVTAYAMQSDRVACLEAGMDDHLSKPLNQQVLVSCLVNLIERQAE